MYKRKNIIKRHYSEYMQKGVRAECSNSCGISLLCEADIVLANIMLIRLLEHVCLVLT